MGLANPGRTCGLTGMGAGLACQGAAGQVFGRVWNWNDLISRSKPGWLAGYPDQLLTLHGLQEGTVSVLDHIRSLMAGSSWSRALEKRWTACTKFWMSKDSPCEPYIRVKASIGIWPRFHNQYFRTATCRQYERGRSIFHQGQMQSTVTQAQWPVYRPWL